MRSSERQRCLARPFDGTNLQSQSNNHEVTSSVPNTLSHVPSPFSQSATLSTSALPNVLLYKCGNVLSTSPSPLTKHEDMRSFQTGTLRAQILERTWYRRSFPSEVLLDRLDWDAEDVHTRLIGEKELQRTRDLSRSREMDEPRLNVQLAKWKARWQWIRGRRSRVNKLVYIRGLVNAGHG